MTAPSETGPVARFVEGLLSVSVGAIGVYGLVMELHTTRSWSLTALGAVAFVIIGAQGVFSVVRGRRSWLARIGPLP